MDATFSGLVLLPLGLGLLGFIEPCSLGSALLFIKYLEGREAGAKLAHVVVFAVTRAVVTGLLGVSVVLLGSMFLGLQRAAWIVLGATYALVGLAFLLNKGSALMVTIGPPIRTLFAKRGSVALGLLFGLNIPACAAPLLFALLAAATAGGASGATVASGFALLGIFGLGLSLPLLLAVLFKRGRQILETLAGVSRRAPVFAGILLIGLGIWSMWFGLFADIKP